MTESDSRTSRLVRYAASAVARVWDLWFLARTTALAVCLPALLRLLSLPRLLSLLDPSHQPPPPTAFGPLRHRVWLVDRLFNRRWGFRRQSCLRRSLVLFRFLRQAGYPVTIVFGVSLTDHVLEGHAWLELDQHPIAEPSGKVNKYRAIYSYPPAPSA